MKRTDIAMIVLIASVSVGLAYFIASSVFGGFSDEGVRVQTVDAIESTIEPPSTQIFNENAINPAVEVQIDDTTQSDATEG